MRWLMYPLFTCTYIDFTVLTANHAPLSQEYAKKGCPVSLRAELWCQILGVDLDEFVSKQFITIPAQNIQTDKSKECR